MFLKKILTFLENIIRILFKRKLDGSDMNERIFMKVKY